MKTRNLYFLGILLLLITYSCQKEEEYHGHADNNYPRYIERTDLLNCKFMPGTFWVYVDSVTNQMDSVHLEQSDSLWLNGLYEYHVMNTVSYPSLETESFAICYSGLVTGFTGMWKSGTDIYRGFPATIPISNYVATSFDSLFVYDRYYHDVLKAEVGNDPTEGDKKSVYYTNSEFGFLRHDVYSGSTLISKKVLVNKNIIR